MVIRKTSFALTVKLSSVKSNLLFVLSEVFTFKISPFEEEKVSPSFVKEILAKAELPTP